MTHYFKPGFHGKKHLVSTCIRGVSLEFITYSSLFSGGEIDLGSKLLIEYITIPNEGVVLDVGCGYGVIGIFVAKANPGLKVYMVDINPLAVKTAKHNAKLNGVDNRVVVLKGDSYEPVKNMFFDAIYSNPPLSAGKSVVERIVLDAKKHLKPNGFAQFVLAKGGEQILDKMRENYSYVEHVSRKGYTLITAKL